MWYTYVKYSQVNAELEAKRTRLKELKPLIMNFVSHGGNLTQEEAKQFRALTMEAESLRFDLAKEPKLENIKTSPDNTMLPQSILAAHYDLRSNKPIYMAIADAANGVYLNSDTAVDNIMNGKNKDVTPQQFYNAFTKTREALKQQYGNTIKLYRAVGAQKHKVTTNWATTEAFAKQFGDKVISRDIPIDNILAVNVGLRGNYHEFIVGEKPHVV